MHTSGVTHLTVPSLYFAFYWFRAKFLEIQQARVDLVPLDELFPRLPKFVVQVLSCRQFRSRSSLDAF
jgi:hypothetical protein